MKDLLLLVLTTAWVVVENFSKLMTDIKLQAHEVQRAPSKINTEKIKQKQKQKPKPWHIIFNLPKTKEKFTRGQRELIHLINSGTKIRITF